MQVVNCAPSARDAEDSMCNGVVVRNLQFGVASRNPFRVIRHFGGGNVPASDRV